MIFIWQGWGILVLFIPLVVLGLTIALFGVLGVDASIVPLGIGLLLAGLALRQLGRYLNGKPGRIVVDENTGERIELRRKHSLFWIPMQHWAWPLFVLAALALFISFFAPPAGS